MTTKILSVVVPLFNESAIVDELVHRCCASAAAATAPALSAFELILVDDGSDDDTPVAVARHVAHSSVRCLRLPENRGQFRATQAGLAAATGEWVVVLDGDLQDPPEMIVDLFKRTQEAGQGVVAVFATKRRRSEATWFRVGQALYHCLQHTLGSASPPRGAGSYCAMRRTVAERVCLARLSHVNLAPVVARAVQAVDGRVATVSYEKQRRYDAASRVGPVGLVREALGSLLVSGALSRLLALTAIGLLVIGAIMRFESGPRQRWSLPLFLLAVLCGGVAVAVHLRGRWHLSALFRASVCRHQRSSILSDLGPLARFALAGVVNTGVDWITYYAASRSILQSQSSTGAKTLGVVCGITSAFVLSSFWVFRDRFVPALRCRRSTVEKLGFILASYAKLFAVYLLGMVVNIVSFMLVRAQGVREILALAVATAASMCINFFILKHVLYRRRQHGQK